tara:strand:+ start:276 stop:632 length:357 start_codon:yes stop_codon:yes gene_type:complete
MSKTRKKLKKALMAGAALYGLGKMMKPDVSDAKAMRATVMNKRRVPAFIKKRGAGMDGAFLPKMPKGKTVIPESEFFGIDPFGPGMGAKKGKMMKAAGGALVGRGQGKVMRVKNTKII